MLLFGKSILVLYELLWIWCTDSWGAICLRDGWFLSTFAKVPTIVCMFVSRLLWPLAYCCAIMPCFLFLLCGNNGWLCLPTRWVLIVDDLLFFDGVYQHVTHVNCLAFSYIHAHPILKIYHSSYRNLWSFQPLLYRLSHMCARFSHREFLLYSKPPFKGRSRIQDDMWFGPSWQIGQ